MQDQVADSGLKGCCPVLVNLGSWEPLGKGFSLGHQARVLE